MGPAGGGRWRMHASADPVSPLAACSSQRAHLARVKDNWACRSATQALWAQRWWARGEEWGNTQYATNEAKMQEGIVRVKHEMVRTKKRQVKTSHN